MNHQELQQNLKQKLQAMQSKGCITPEVWIRFDGAETITGRVDYYPATQYKDLQYKVWSDTSLANVLADMSQFILEIKPLSERKHEAFLKSVAAAIEAGRKAGVETEFLSPLEAAMRKLSENAIEHRPASPEMPMDFVPSVSSGDLLR